MCIFVPNMKFVSVILSLGGLCTDTDADTNTDTKADNDNYARRTNHDYTGSFGIIPNEPKCHLAIMLDTHEITI